MAVSVSILNKQRRVCVELAFLQDAVERLSMRVLESLSLRPAKHLNERDVRLMRERGSLSLVLVSNRRIRTLNRDWREKDYATDVLSFPLAVSENGVFSRDQTDEETWELGELVISVEKAVEQA
jgi:ssRNA-specific RNase YbeY (16S rRNA maturation enzyme)